MDTASSLALTDIDAKPRWNGCVSNPEPSNGSPPILESADEFDGVEGPTGHVNASVDHIERPLMTPDEVLRLKPPQKQSKGTQEHIIAPGQMLIFVSGHHPILGTQMLFFLDPVLNSRADLAPPTEFITLMKGQPIPQLPLNRTQNVVSGPELAPAGETHSGVEQGLVETLHLEKGN